MGDEELARRLGGGDSAVMACLRSGKLLFDVRTLFDHQMMCLVKALSHALA